MMKKYTKTAGLLFMAASSVYYGQAVVAAPAKSAPGANGAKSDAPTNVRLLDDLVPTAPAVPARWCRTPRPAPRSSIPMRRMPPSLRVTARALARDAGYVVGPVAPTVIPVEFVLGLPAAHLACRAIRVMMWALARLRGTLFGYQFVMTLHAADSERR